MNENNIFWIALIRGEVRKAYKLHQTDGVIFRLCPRCFNALVFFVEQTDLQSPTGKVVRIECYEGCGWKILL